MPYLQYLVMFVLVGCILLLVCRVFSKRLGVAKVRNPKLRVHEFSLVIGATEITNELEQAIHRAGCDDSTIYRCSGCRGVSISFSRRAVDLETALASAILDIRRAGYELLEVNF